MVPNEKMFNQGKYHSISMSMRRSTWPRTIAAIGEVWDTDQYKMRQPVNKRVSYINQYKGEYDNITKYIPYANLEISDLHYIYKIYFRDLWNSWLKLYNMYKTWKPFTERVFFYPFKTNVHNVSNKEDV